MKHFAILLTCIVLFACKKDNNAPDTQDSFIYPLNMGNSWTYTLTGYEEAGWISYTLTHTVTVTGAQSPDNTAYYRLTSDNGPSPFSLRNVDSKTVEKNDGRGSFIFLKLVSSNNELVQSTNTTIGGCAINGSSYGFSEISKIGNYDCLRMEQIYKNCSGVITNKLIYYFKPGIGLVNTEHYLLRSDNTGLFLVSREELTGYTLL